MKREELKELSYNELRRLAAEKEAELENPQHPKKEELVEALANQETEEDMTEEHEVEVNVVEEEETPEWRRRVGEAMPMILGALLGGIIVAFLTLLATGYINVSAGPQPTQAPPTTRPITAPEPTEVPEEANFTETNNSEVNTSEPLEMTLDEFGGRIRYDDRFPLGGGMIWDQSYVEGEIFVGNMLAIHDHSFESQEGCVVTYYQASEGGGRIRFTAWDGMGFELDTDSGVSLNQAIAAMRETLIRAHGCDPDQIQYHRAVRHGDPVK